MPSVRRALSLAVLTVLALSPLWADDKKPDHSAVKPVDKKDGFWVDRHKAFLEVAKKGEAEVVFLGDSITQLWEAEGKDAWMKNFAPLKAANFGISADRTEHVLWRITEGKELEGLKPKLFVVMIGTNNTGVNKADEIADGITAIVNELTKQKPEAKVLLLGIFPRSPSAGDAVRKLIKEVNEKIAKLDGKQVKYLDLGEKFLTKDGELTKEIMYDYLHLTPKGYEIWAEAIKGPVAEMVKK